LKVVVVVGDATARLPPSATIDETMRAAATNDPNIRLVEWFESALFAWVVVVMGGDNT